jgi:PBSX family phage portal protein
MTETTVTVVRKRRGRSEEIEERITKLMSGVPPEPASHQNFSAEEATMWSGSGVDVVVPDYDPSMLATLPEDSDELGQCIDAIVTGVCGYGSRIVADFPLEKGVVPPDIAEVVKQEAADLQNFLDSCGADDDYDSMRTKCITDLVTTGNCYFEIVRGMDGLIQSIEHVVAAQIRHIAQDDEHTLVRAKMKRKRADGRSELFERAEYRRFRRFVQLSNVQIFGSTKGALQRTYFKSLGDPRNYDNETGQLLGKLDATGKYVEDALEVATAKLQHRLANELVHFTSYNVKGSSYGLPKFIGNLYSIEGARLCEKLNYFTFKSNNVPSAAVCVSGGQLTEKSIIRLKDFVDSHIEGSHNMSKMVLLEAESVYENDEAGPAVKIDIKPLTAVQRSEGMFTAYHEDCRAAIRGAWRLPPILVGRSQEWSGVVIDGARKLADETIFAPLRVRWDKFFNRKIVPLLGYFLHRIESNTPNTTDNVALVNLLAAAEKSGAVTPRIARQVLEQVLGRELPPFPEGFDADVPFSATMAELVKNEADPTEPGQQVTAIK